MKIEFLKRFLDPLLLPSVASSIVVVLYLGIKWIDTSSRKRYAFRKDMLKAVSDVKDTEVLLIEEEKLDALGKPFQVSLRQPSPFLQVQNESVHRYSHQGDTKQKTSRDNATCGGGVSFVDNHSCTSMCVGTHRSGIKLKLPTTSRTCRNDNELEWDYYDFSPERSRFGLTSRCPMGKVEKKPFKEPSSFTIGAVVNKSAQKLRFPNMIGEARRKSVEEQSFSAFDDEGKIPAQDLHSSSMISDVSKRSVQEHIFSTFGDVDTESVQYLRSPDVIADVNIKVFQEHNFSTFGDVEKESVQDLRSPNMIGEVSKMSVQEQNVSAFGDLGKESVQDLPFSNMIGDVSKKSVKSHYLSGFDERRKKSVQELSSPDIIYDTRKNLFQEHGVSMIGNVDKNLVQYNVSPCMITDVMKNLVQYHSFSMVGDVEEALIQETESATEGTRSKSKDATTNIDGAEDELFYSLLKKQYLFENEHFKKYYHIAFVDDKNEDF